MEKIDFVLTSDGGSDRTLLPPIKWLLRRTFSQIPINGEWAEISRFHYFPQSLAERICITIEVYHPDILFIHRDAEAQDPNFRYEEISRAIAEVRRKSPDISIPHICVVPIRMTEAWLLFDEQAIRKAAGNPRGRIPLELPPIIRLETIPDPKGLLFSRLYSASELTGRKRERFDLKKCRYLVAEYIEDYSPLFALSAFKRLHEDIKHLAAER
jgi:hypothetical protein